MKTKLISSALLIPLAFICMGQTYNDSPSPGSWSILGTEIASASATIDFAALPVGYRDFMVIISDVVPATDGAVLWSRVSVAAVFKSGVSDYGWSLSQVLTSSAETNDGDAADSEWQISPGVGSAAGEGITAVLILFDPENASNRAKIIVDGVAERSDGIFSRYMAGGRAVGTIGVAVVDGIRFLFSSGNIASGTFTLYGRMN